LQVLAVIEGERDFGDVRPASVGTGKVQVTTLYLQQIGFGLSDIDIATENVDIAHTGFGLPKKTGEVVIGDIQGMLYWAIGLLAQAEEYSGLVL
jgi:hypothetical protein